MKKIIYFIFFLFLSLSFIEANAKGNTWIPIKTDEKEDAFIIKDAGLAFPDGQLRAVFDFARSLFREAMDQFLPGFIKPFQIFQKKSVIGAHIRLPLLF